MKRVIALILLAAFLFVSGVVMAETACGTCGNDPCTCTTEKCVSFFEKMRCSIKSWGKPQAEKVEAVKEPAPVLTAEELKAKRATTGVGMRGIIGNE